MTFTDFLSTGHIVVMVVVVALFTGAVILVKKYIAKYKNHIDKIVREYGEFKGVKRDTTDLSAEVWKSKERIEKLESGILTQEALANLRSELVRETERISISRKEAEDLIRKELGYLESTSDERPALLDTYNKIRISQDSEQERVFIETNGIRKAEMHEHIVREDPRGRLLLFEREQECMLLPGFRAHLQDPIISECFATRFGEIMNFESDVWELRSPAQCTRCSEGWRLAKRGEIGKYSPPTARPVPSAQLAGRVADLDEELKNTKEKIEQMVQMVERGVIFLDSAIAEKIAESILKGKKLSEQIQKEVTVGISSFVEENKFELLHESFKAMAKEEAQNEVSFLLQSDELGKLIDSRIKAAVNQILPMEFEKARETLCKSILESSQLSELIHSEIKRLKRPRTRSYGKTVLKGDVKLVMRYFNSSKAMSDERNRRNFIEKNHAERLQAIQESKFDDKLRYRRDSEGQFLKVETKEGFFILPNFETKLEDDLILATFNTPDARISKNWHLTKPAKCEKVDDHWILLEKGEIAEGSSDSTSGSMPTRPM